MKLRFSITAKIAIGFGTLTLLYVINVFFIYQTLLKNQQDHVALTEQLIPSLRQVEKLQNYITQSRLLLKSWVYIEKEPITPDKLKLLEILDLEIPYLEKNIQKLYHQWPTSEQVIYQRTEELINDSLIVLSKEIINALNQQELYNEDQLQSLQPLMGNSGQLIWLANRIESKLSILLNMQQERLLSTQNLMHASMEKARAFLLTLSILLVLMAIIIAFVTIRVQIIPLNFIKKVLKQLGKGVFPNEKLKERNDELGEIAAAVNTLVKGLKEISTFSIEIGKGNFNWPFQPLSEEDILGNSLIKMREELRNAAIEEEKRKKEDQQRNWATQGIAKFSEILRQNNNDLDELSSNIISNLVNYLGANQGGIFIKEEEGGEVFLRLSACYAYDRKKFLEKTFKPGEGLIGRCYLERQTIFLTEIPKDYIKITSGMGEASPTCLLIVPLLHNDIVYGVIELASFHAFEPYQIEFVERIASSIASTISIVQINVQTTKLLEQSRRQAEEMLAQEANLKQTIEELKAAQDEAERREAALQKEIKVLKEKLARYEI
ncbi:MAG TPA: GAF domain-containing protein [Bacteroidales bacterium]|nr:GAF domain-containing protein [Bacteroidales bacterium]HPO65505.1 GAF domain-containing protein [Bacteroidales bacterium]